MQPKRLYRSEQDRMLGGVCGGLGAYLDVDATLVRVVFVVLAFFSVGVLLYLAMWVIVPSESALDKPAQQVAREGMSDIRDRARDGARQARGAVDRLRGRGEGEGRGDAGDGGDAGPASRPGPGSHPEDPGAAGTG